MKRFYDNLPPGVLPSDVDLDKRLELTDIDREEWKADVENDDKAMQSEYYPEDI